MFKKYLYHISVVLIAVSVIISCSGNDQSRQTQLNMLSESEKDSGWTLLFDGETTDGWRGIYLEHFPENGWSVEDGSLTVHESSEPQERGGAIITVDQYSSFELSLEFQYEQEANSGIKYFVLERQDTTLGHGLGLEYQIWNDENPREADKKLAALYDLIPAGDKSLRPVGAWNNARLIVNGSQVEHWLNGNKVVEFNRHSDEFRTLVAESKYHEIEDFGEYPRGHILLQDEGLKTSFRNIKIRELE